MNRFSVILIAVSSVVWAGPAPAVFGQSGGECRPLRDEQSRYRIPVPEAAARLGEERYVRSVAGGRSVGEEDAAWLARHERIGEWLESYPDLAVELSRHPYAAQHVYRQPFFEGWRSRHPERADGIVDAARRWREMDSGEKAEFFRCHPRLPSEGMLWPEDRRRSPRGGEPRPGEAVPQGPNGGEKPSERPGP